MPSPPLFFRLINFIKGLFNRVALGEKRQHQLERQNFHVIKQLEMWQGIAIHYRLQNKELHWDIQDLLPLAQGKPIDSLTQHQQSMITLMKYLPALDEPKILAAVPPK
jgi:hypothetical protein